MDLLKKYQVLEHLDNLHRPYRRRLFQRESVMFEDVIDKSDKDLKPILDFRDEVERNDRISNGKVKRHRTSSVQNMLNREYDWLIQQIANGDTCRMMGEKLAVSDTTIRRYIQGNMYLNNLYGLMKERRQNRVRNTRN